MAYDEDLANRLQAVLQHTGTLEPKRMFGGIGFMVDGHLAVCVMSDGRLLARVGTDAAERLVGSGVEPMLMSSRPMKGWLAVDAALVEDDAALAEWGQRCVSFVRSGALESRV